MVHPGGDADVVVGVVCYQGGDRTHSPNIVDITNLEAT